MCQCTLNNIVNNNIFGNNILLQKSFGELQEILTKTNIEVMKCYKDLFDKEMYKNNTGFFIIIILIILNIILIFIYYFKFRIKIKRYIMGMIDIFISYLKKTKNNNLIVVSNKQNELILKSNPPKNNNNCNPENNDKEIKIERNKTKNKSKIINIKKKKLFSINNNKSIKCINSSIPQNSYDTFNKSNTILEKKIKYYFLIIHLAYLNN